MSLKSWLWDTFSTEALLTTLLLVGFGAMIFAGYAVRSLAEPSAAVTGRRVDWRRGFVILPLALIPYWSNEAAFMMLPAILFRAAYFLDRVWVMRSIGPARYAELLQLAAANTPPRITYACIAASGALTALAGAALWLFSPGAERSWAFWFAMGLMVYGAVTALQRARRVRRITPAQIRVGDSPVA